MTPADTHSGGPCLSRSVALVDVSFSARLLVCARGLSEMCAGGPELHHGLARRPRASHFPSELQVPHLSRGLATDSAWLFRGREAASHGTCSGTFGRRYRCRLEGGVTSDLEIHDSGSWSPRGPSLLGKTPRKGLGGRKCCRAERGREKSRLSGGEGRRAGPSCARRLRWGSRRGSLPPTGLPPGREKRPFRILWCLVGEQGRGPLAFCPAIWRAGLWPRLPLGDAGPLPRQQLLLSPREAVGRWHCGDDQAGAGPRPVTPPSIPGARAAVTHISAPAVRLLLWP